MGEYSDMYYAGFLNVCEFDGYVFDKPVVEIDDNFKARTVYKASFLLKQGDMLIPCIAYERYAIRLEAILDKGDKIYMKAKFKPVQIEDKLFFRFLVMYVVILEKELNPISVEITGGKDLAEYL